MSNTGFLDFVQGLFNHDRPQQPAEPQQTNIATRQTGWKAVKQMFQTDEFSNISPEAHSVLQTGCLGVVVGGFYGGLTRGRNTYEQFIRNNEATKFRTALEARSKLQDTITLSFGKGAFMWSWRIGMFTTLVMGTAAVIQVYRGKYGIMEYAYGGALAGAVYKFYSGPRAWLVGGGLGGVLGFIGGACSYGLLKISGQTMEDARYWQQRITQRREELVRKGKQQGFEEQDLAVIKLHNDEVGESGHSIENLESSKRAGLHVYVKEV